MDQDCFSSNIRIIGQESKPDTWYSEDRKWCAFLGEGRLVVIVNGISRYLYPYQAHIPEREHGA